MAGCVASTPGRSAAGTSAEYAIKRWWVGSARRRATASGCGALSKRCAAALTRSLSPGPSRTISGTGRGWTSGGQVDSNRPQPLVQRIKRELEDLALGVSELGDVAQIGRAHV